MSLFDSKAKAKGAAANAPTEFPLFVNALAKELVWIKEGAVTQFLKSVSGRADPLLVQLNQIKLLDELDIEKAAQDEGSQNVPIIEGLVKDGKLGVAWFAETLRYQDGFPLCEKKKGTFAEYLLSQNVVNYSTLMRLLKSEGQSRRRVESLAVETDSIDPDRIYKALADFSDATYKAEPKVQIGKKELSYFPAGLISAFSLVPYEYNARSMKVCSCKPIPNIALKYLSTVMGRKVSWVITSPESFNQVLEALEELTPQTATLDYTTEEENMEIEGLFSKKGIELDTDSTVEMVANLIQQAVDNRATDIHLEPRRYEMNIRYRIDGFLYEVGRVEHQVGREIISRIKILADMDITERRLPQDGHFRFSTGQSEFDMRLATVPTNFGERMEIRLAEGGKLFTALDQLGLTKSDMKVVNGFIGKPHGIVLATGPVGSGKTTTLYSCISKVDQKALNVMTIEDPIEYIIPGANQIEVNYKVNFDFVHGLRAILRQDPDVILVGEIRDEETAKIAIRAGMTGMLVFSTLHANDSVGSVTTLTNFQINRFLIASSLVGSLAQRLVRKICPHCAMPVKADKSVQEALGLTAAKLKSFKLQKGKGCNHCFNTGYSGRTGIFEIFNVTNNIRNLIMSGETEQVIYEAALKEGLIPLKEAALSKVKDGTTTVEEFVRLLG